MKTKTDTMNYALSGSRKMDYYCDGRDKGSKRPGPTPPQRQGTDPANNKEQTRFMTQPKKEYHKDQFPDQKYHRKQFPGMKYKCHDM